MTRLRDREDEMIRAIHPTILAPLLVFGSLLTGCTGNRNASDKSEYSPPTSREVRTFTHPGPVVEVVVSPDGKKAFTSCGHLDKKLRLWDLDTGEILHTYEGGRTSVPGPLAFLPDGRGVLVGNYPSSLQIIDLNTGKELQTFRAPQELAVSCLAISADGKRALSGGMDRMVRLWDVETGEELEHIDVHIDGELADDPRSVTFLPSDRVLIGKRNGLLLVYDLKTKTQAVVCGEDINIESWKVAISADGKKAVVCHVEGLIMIWDLDNRQKLREWEVDITGIASIAMTTDGSRVLSGQGGAMRLWDVETGKELHTFIVNKATALNVTFSPDGRRALSSDGDTMRLFQVP
jgi:WD40 repeat protein